MKKTVLLILLAGMSMLSHAQNNFSSVVTDGMGGTVEAAYVRLKSKDQQFYAYTDTLGRFAVNNVPDGSYTLTISHIAYNTLTKEISVPYKGGVLAMKQMLGQLDVAIVRTVRVTRNAPSTFSNINKETIKQTDQSKDFPFLLNTTPSTVISSDAGNGVGYTGIRIRGVDPTRVNVTINGIPYNDAESQGTFWVNMPDLASSTQSVQVQRGVGSSTNGAAAFGASVNVQTNNIPNKKRSEATVALGSFNTFRTSVLHSTGRLKGNWAFQVRGSVIESDGFIDRASSDLRSLNLAGVKYLKRSTFKANILLGKERTYQAWYGIPQPKFEGNTSELTRYVNQLWITGDDLTNLQNANSKTYNLYTYENEVDNYNQNHYQFFFDHRFSKYTKLSSAAYVTTGKGYFEQFRSQDDLADYGLPNEIIGTDTFASADLVRRRWLDNTLVGGLASITRHKKRLKTVVGAAYNVYQGRHFGEVIATEFTGYEDLNALYYDNDATKSDGNIYTKVSYKWRNWIPYVDLQVRAVNYKFEGLDNNLEFGNQETNYTFFNPKVGFTYIHKNKTIYALYAVGNREPSRDDFRNNKPTDWPEHETLNNIEVGYRYIKARGELKINLYDMSYQNQLVLTGAVNDVGEAVRTNVENSHRRGVELEFQVPITKTLQFGGNATLSENKIDKFTEFVGEWDDDFETFSFEHTNTDISFSPNSIAALMLGYRPNEHWNFDLFGKRVGKQYLDNTQSEDRALAAFTNLDASIRYNTDRISGAREINVGLYINNVLNQFYAPNGYTFSGYLAGQRADFNYLYPMAGRNVMIKLGVAL